jgi:hypothetical protein
MVLLSVNQHFQGLRLKPYFENGMITKASNAKSNRIGYVLGIDQRPLG